MMDVIVLGLVVCFFALAIGYATPATGFEENES
jgi:hypothetical protein